VTLNRGNERLRDWRPMRIDADLLRRRDTIPRRAGHAQRDEPIARRWWLRRRRSRRTSRVSLTSSAYATAPRRRLV